MKPPKPFLVRYVLADGTRAQLHAPATSSFAALDIVQRLFGVHLRYATVRPAAH